MNRVSCYVATDTWENTAARANATERGLKGEGEKCLPIKKLLNSGVHPVIMRVAMATVVALLILNFVDEHFNDARYTRAATAIFSQIAESFG
jgi:hypothetical protein